MTQTMNLEGRVAVVTGANRGIGKAVAVKLAAAGCAVVVGGRVPERVEAAAAEIRQAGARAVAHPGDVSDPVAAAAIIERAITEFGRLDILINNAGISRGSPFFEITPESWREFLDVHLSGNFYCGQAAARIMKDSGGGRIVNVSSIAASMAMYGTAPYAAAKGGILSLTRVMAVELAKFGITVNAIAPGPVATEQLRAVYDEKMYQERSRAIPLGRLAEPEEVASAVLFLVSPEACYITGQVLTLDGGASAVGCYSYETYKRSQ